VSSGEYEPNYKIRRVFQCNTVTVTKSLANAKVRARKQCVYEGPLAKKSMTNQRKEC